MKFIFFLSNAFINTMGITQPSPQTARRAAWFIAILLACVVSVIAIVLIFAVRWASHP